MKLVEINDVRPGQVLERDRCIFVIEERTGAHNFAVSLYCHNHKPAPNNAYEVLSMRERNVATFNDCEIIGKIGITHRIEGNRLVEIPREDLIVDDVVEYLDFDGFKVTAVIAEVITGMTREDSQYGFITNDGNFDESSLFEKEEIGEDSGIFTYTPKKIGVLGVTHEFVNDREVQQ